MTEEAYTPPKATPWRHEQIREWLRVALKEKLGREPCHEVITILHAKTVLECGRSGDVEGISCWCGNVGNIRGVSKDGLYTILVKAWERKKNGERYSPADQRFRAYLDPIDGVRDLVSLLSSKDYSKAWAVLSSEKPTPEAYAIAAKSCGYFTANLYDEQDADGKVSRGYLTQLVQIYKEFMRKWPVQDGNIPDKEMQRLLRLLGYDPGPIDGIVGPKTRAAIKLFQRDQSVPMDGKSSIELKKLIQDAALKKAKT